MKIFGFIVIVVALLGSGCAKTATQSSSLPFTYTNLSHEVSPFNSSVSTQTIIYFPDGRWFAHKNDRSTLGFGASDYEITVFYNPTNSSITKILQQTTVGTNNYWLLDRNGDGVPEEREAFGNKGDELLIDGDWVKARGKPSEREVHLDGKWTPVTFTRGFWRVSHRN